jgi:DNA recombination protein RmuC
MSDLSTVQAWLAENWLLVGGFGVLVLCLWALLRPRRDQTAQQLAQIHDQFRHIAAGQEQLRGGLQHVSEAQASARLQILQTVEVRLAETQQRMNDRLNESAMRNQRSLAEMQARMNDTLHGTSQKTVTSLTRLQERLAVIDKAQDNITRLSGDVLGLQDILSNKQTRGAFGEIQLRDIVSAALPPDSYDMQVTLPNGKRADCLIRMPNPPGPIVIDAKFPLEAYEALRRAEGQAEQMAAARMMRSSVRAHIRAIAEKYILDGETADSALMFLPSEAVYAELHANYPDLVREGFAARVWIVSPTTCMATLHTLRAVLKDARMRDQAGAIRAELGLLYKDLERLGDRVSNLDRHFGQAAKDLGEIRVSAEKAGRRAQRLDSFDFGEDTPEDVAPYAGRKIT